MNAMRVIFVGGFLGAGKTTLLRAAARGIASRGKCVAALTNDQTAPLVDTLVLGPATAAVAEVAGGCFCCRFGDLLARLRQLRRQTHPDVILAEPVGSCTDLVATVLRPLNKFHHDEAQLAPMSVLVDPVRFAQSGDADAAGLAADIWYIYRLQFQEADAIVINKIDLLSPAEREAVLLKVKEQAGDRPVFAVSGLSGEGLEPWLDFVMSHDFSGGSPLEVDYDRYALGEAALGWLNASVRLQADGGANWHRFCEDLLMRIREDLRSRAAEIAHAKIVMAALEGQLTASLVSSAAEVAIVGSLSEKTESVGTMINLRAQTEPQYLNASFMEALHAAAASAGARVSIVEFHAFSPDRPRPTYRIRA